MLGRFGREQLDEFWRFVCEYDGIQLWFDINFPCELPCGLDKNCNSKPHRKRFEREIWILKYFANFTMIFRIKELNEVLV